MNDSTRAIALSALLALSMAAGAVALTGTTVAETGVDAGGVPAVQANETDVPQIQTGETMTIRGETSLDAATNNVTVEVTEGPSADTFETVTVDEWGDDGVWSAELFVSEDVEPGTYTAEITVGGATTTTEFEVVEQQAAQGNETPAAADNETTEEDGILIGDDNETNATADNETVAVNETELAANETPTDQFQPGQTMVVRGTTSLSADDNNVTVEVTEGPGAEAFETVTVDEWEEDGNWSAEVPIPEDAEPGTYTAEITVGDATTTTEFEVVEQQAAQGNETTPANETAANETTTEEDGGLFGDDNETAANETETPTETTTETETPTETPTEEDPAVGEDETPEDEPGAGAGETTTPGQPGFGIVAALAALAVSLLALARRRQ